MEPRCSSNGDVPTSKEMVDWRTTAGVPSIALNPHFIEWSLHLSAILEWRSYKGWWGCVLAMVCPVSMLFSALLQNRPFVPVPKDYLSRFWNRDSAAGRLLSRVVEPGQNVPRAKKSLRPSGLEPKT